MVAVLPICAMATDIFKDILDPYTKQSILLTTKGVKPTFSASNVLTSLDFKLRYPLNPDSSMARDFRASVMTDIARHFATSADFTLNWEVAIDAAKVSDKVQPHPKIKNIIGVFANKGGVGKSSVSASLALGLHSLGARVGILDADIYGPSMPLIFDIEQEYPEPDGGKNWQPVRKNGLEIISIGNLLQKNAPAIWRGPMVSSALRQLLTQTSWDNLDYLIVDLPPGTGDIQLSLIQGLPLTAAVVVTTPQPLALADVKKNMTMLAKLNVTVLGVVENMAKVSCDNCNHTMYPFGKSLNVRAELELDDVLASLPLSPQFADYINNGKVWEVTKLPLWSDIENFSLQVGAKIAGLPRDYRHSFGNIIVE